MAGPSSRFLVLSAAASLETTLTGTEVHTAPLTATQLTILVITTRACTLSIQVRDDAGTWSEVESESPGIGTNAYPYPGNYGAIRVVATVVGSSAWTIQVYAQAS